MELIDILKIVGIFDRLEYVIILKRTDKTVNNELRNLAEFNSLIEGFHCLVAVERFVLQRRYSQLTNLCCELTLMTLMTLYSVDPHSYFSS